MTSKVYDRTLRNSFCAWTRTWNVNESLSAVTTTGTPRVGNFADIEVNWSQIHNETVVCCENRVADRRISTLTPDNWNKLLSYHLSLASCEDVIAAVVVCPLSVFKWSSKWLLAYHLNCICIHYEFLYVLDGRMCNDESVIPCKVADNKPASQPM